MILAEASTALTISITLVTITLVVVSLLIILVVMMQRPKQEGLGAAFGGGMTDQLLGAGTTSFLQKATVMLGVLFFVLSLVLSILIGRSNRQLGLTVVPETSSETTAAPLVPGDIEVPAASEQDELLKALEAATADEAVTEEATPAAEEEPSVDEVIIPGIVETPGVEVEMTEEPAPAEEAEEAVPEEAEDDSVENEEEEAPAGE